MLPTYDEMKAACQETLDNLSEESRAAREVNMRTMPQEAHTQALEIIAEMRSIDFGGDLLENVAKVMGDSLEHYRKQPLLEMEVAISVLRVLMDAKADATRIAQSIKPKKISSPDFETFKKAIEKDVSTMAPEEISRRKEHLKGLTHGMYRGMMEHFAEFKEHFPESVTDGMALVLGDSLEHFVSQPFIDVELVIGLLRMFNDTKQEVKASREKSQILHDVVQGSQIEHWHPAV